MAVTEELVLEIRGDLRDIRTSLRTLQRDGDNTSRRLSRSFAQAGRQINAAFRGLRNSALAIGAAAAGFGVLASRSLQASESIQDLADRAGVSAEFLQELRFATNQSGASARDFDDAISRLNRRFGLYVNNLQTGTGEAGPARAAFQALGLEARIMSGELQDAEQVFFAVVDALQDVESQSRRSALASQLFGEDSGPRLVALLDQGTEGISRMSSEARELGVVLDNELVANAAAASDQLEIMQTMFSAEVNRAIAENAQSLSEFARALGDIAIFAIDAAARFGEFYSGVQNAMRMFTGETPVLISEQQYRAERRRLTELIAVFSARAQEGRGGVVREQTLRSFIGDQRVEEIIRDFGALSTAEAQGPIAEALAARWQELGRELSELRQSVERQAAAAAGGTGSGTLGGITSPETKTALESTGMVIEMVAQEVEDLKNKTDEASGSFEGLRDEAVQLGEDAQTAVKGFEDAFIRAIESGRLELESLGRLIIRIFAQRAFQDFLSGPIGSLASAVFGGGPGKATGGPASGMTLVGEQGPELVNLGPMANVMTANMTRLALSGAGARRDAGGVAVANNITIDARGADQGVEDRLRAALAEAIPRIQRDTVEASIQTIANINRNNTVF